MKITVEVALNALGELEKLGERQTSKGEVLKGITIPANKAKTGLLLGRMKTKLTSIQTDFSKQQEALIKQLGEPLKQGGNIIEGQFQVKPENSFEYQVALKSMLAVEEEVAIEQIDFSLLDGIEFPASFWASMEVFINDSK